MSDLRPPRFPYVGALLCAACVGMAGYLWLKYSYCWEVTPRELLAVGEREMDNPWAAKYVTVRGETLVNWTPSPVGGGRELLAVIGEGEPKHDAEWPVRQFTILLENTDSVVSLAPREGGGPQIVSGDRRTGRLNWQSCSHYTWYAYLEMSAGRFTPPSVAGLVVGAMGVFVFTVALRHWLGERRRFREEARA